MLGGGRDRGEPIGLPVRIFGLGSKTTVASGSNGAAPPTGWIGEGSTSMFFFNVQAGDAPYLKSLADAYTMSDNYHQAVLGGTGANHIMMGPSGSRERNTR